MSKTYLGYGYTNENGVATLDYDPNGDELPRRSYQCRSRTATVVAETTVEGVTHSSAKMKFCEGYVPPKPVPTLSITGSDIDVGETLSLTGTLSAGSGKSVKVYQGNTLIDTVTTGNEGAYSTSVSELGAGTYTFRAEFGGDDEYSSVVSSTLEITVSKLTPTISLTGSDISVGETLALSGVLSAGSGYSVKIYQGSSLVDTVTTGTGGAFTSSISNLDVGSYGFYAVFEGDGVYEEVVSSNVQITVSKITPTISLNGSDITFREPLNLSGTLSVGSGKTVKIYKTNVLMDTVTTGSEGAFTSTLNNIDAGTYEFRAVFEGDSTYEEAISSKSIHISKLQPTITFTGSNITVGETLNLSGVLSVGSGESIKIYQGESVIDTVTTGANGAFSKSITGLTAGTYTFKALFEGGNNYQGVMSSAVSITVSEVQQSLAVSVDESVLSYVGGDEAVVSATLTGGTVSGQSVVFKKGSTVLATETTNSSGVATYTYTSQGVGDVTITAECNSLSDDIDIEDCLYAPKLDGTETIHQIQGTTTISNGEMYGGSGYVGAFDNTGNWEVTFKGKLGNNNCAVWLIKSDETIRDNNEIISPFKSVWKYENGQSTSYNFENALEYDTYYPYKITKNGNTITFEVNGNTVSFTWSLATTLPTLSVGVDSWGQGNAYIKDVKVKPLPTPSSLSVSSNKSVLSYYDSDSATITATLLRGSRPISGETVTFKNGSTVLGTDITDANGVAEYTYTSQGVGDVTFTVECMNLQETYELEDCKYAMLDEISYVSEYSSGDHGIDIDANLALDLGENCEISFDAKANNGSSIRARLLLGSKSAKHDNGVYDYNFGGHLETNIITAMYRDTEGTNYWGSDVPCIDTYANYKFVKNGTSLSCYINGNQQGNTVTLSWIDDHKDYLFFWWVYRYGTIYAKNIKVKPL